jgi:hypothetical protein
MATVKVQNDKQQTLPLDAHELLHAPNLEGRVVVVRGQAKRDDAGNLTILAAGIFVRPRETGKE